MKWGLDPFTTMVENPSPRVRSVRWGAADGSDRSSHSVVDRIGVIVVTGAPHTLRQGTHHSAA